MGIVFVKSDKFEIRIEEEFLFKTGETRDSLILKPHIAKLIDDLTEKFSTYNTLKTHKMLEKS